MKQALIVLAVVLSGCAHVYRDGAGVQAPYQVVSECEYEALKASAGARPGMEAGWIKGEITTKCLALKGYRL